MACFVLKKKKKNNKYLRKENVTKTKKKKEKAQNFSEKGAFFGFDKIVDDQ